MTAVAISVGEQTRLEIISNFIFFFIAGSCEIIVKESRNTMQKEF